MFEFHKDRKRYFDMQVLNTEKHVIPFIRKSFPLEKGMRVLEVGCGEGGVLKAFTDFGCMGIGVELEAGRIETGIQWLQPEIESGSIVLLSKDIYEVNPQQELGGLFDVIVLKDVIEHIHDQQKLVDWLASFLNPGGVIFFGFPPWQMPFGGHQQMCRNKLLSKLPYYHLFPAGIYRAILKKFREPVDELMEIRDTRLSIEKFERIIRKKYRINRKTFYVLNPIYEYKFGWKPIAQWKLISSIPYLRNFLTTTVYYLISPNA